MNHTEKSLLSKTAISGSCIVWKASKTYNGYGRLGKTRAHRAVWMLFNGEIPANARVCHRCDNRACCFIGHLFIATQLENIHDMYRKGRQAARLKGISQKPWKSDDSQRLWILANPDKYRAILDRRNARRRKTI